MSDAHSAPHAGIGICPFTEAEIREFQESDKRTGAAVIMIMTAIFLVGFLLYASVALIV